MKHHLKKPSAGVKYYHTNTSFPVLPYISDTESEVILLFCTQDFQQDLLSLENHLAKETTGIKSLQKNHVCEEELSHNSKEGELSDRKLKLYNVFSTVS